MAYAFDTAFVPATGAEAIWRLVDLLVTDCGWSVRADSDGTTYDSNGGAVTHGGSGSGGLNNASAWVVVRSPNGREICFQRNANTGANTARRWRIKYSRAAGFSGGSPSATRVPSASDEAVIRGGGTDASPTVEIIFWSNDGLQKVSIVGQTSSPHGFALFGWISATPDSTDCAIMLDPLLAVAEDTDPYVLYIPSPTGADQVWKDNAATGITASGSSPFGWLDLDGTPTFQGIQALAPVRRDGGGTLQIGTQNGQPLGGNTQNGKDDLLPMYYGRAVASGNPAGMKGRSTLVRWRVLARTDVNTHTVQTERDWIIIGHVALPWDGSNPGTTDYPANDWVALAGELGSGGGTPAPAPAPRPIGVGSGGFGFQLD